METAACHDLTPSEIPVPLLEPSGQSGASQDEPSSVYPPITDLPGPPPDRRIYAAIVREKIKRGIPLSQQEKAVLTKDEKDKITLEELEETENRILKQLSKNIGSIPTKDLPKALEIVKTAINERKAKGEKGAELGKPKEPTREEMLAAIQGRRNGPEK